VGGAARRSAAEPRGVLGYQRRARAVLLAARIFGVSYFMQGSSEPRMARTNNAQLVSLTPIFVHAENIFEYGFALPGAIRAL